MIRKRNLMIGLIVILALAVAVPALAANPFTETGVVTSIDVSGFELNVDGTLYTVLPPAGFDLTTLMVDEIVEVEGEEEAGVVTASSITQTGYMVFSETGTVASIGVDSFEFDVAGTLYTVLPPAGFDLTTLTVGDTVQVEGAVDTVNVVAAISIVIVGPGLIPFSETGTVASIGADSFEFDVAGMLYTVLPPAGFDLATLMVGDTVQVEGTVDASNVVTATSIIPAGPTPFSETGTVASIGADSFEFDVAGMLYTVLPPAGFDLATLMVGDTVQVEGTVDASNVVTATSIIPAGPTPFSETGTVASIGADSFEFDVAGMLYTVLPPAGFDLATLMVGDTVQVEGTVDASNVVTATSIILAGPTPFSESGTVASIGADSFEFDVAGMLYTVLPPAGFDLATLMVGDTVQVEGTVDALNVVTATSILIVTEAEEVVEFVNDGYYCESADSSQPALQKLADRFDAPYEEVLAFFCGTSELGPHGVGEIKHAYETAAKLDDGTTPAEILRMKDEMGGWGNVWQYFGLIGNSNNGGAPESAGKPEHAGGPPENKGKP